MKWLTAKFHRIEARLNLAKPPSDNASDEYRHWWRSFCVHVCRFGNRHVTARPPSHPSSTTSTNTKEKVLGSSGGDSKSFSPDSNYIAT